VMQISFSGSTRLLPIMPPREMHGRPNRTRCRLGQDTRVPPERERQSLADELSPSEAEEEAPGGAWPPQLQPESQPPPPSPVHPAPSVPHELPRRLWQLPSLHPRPESLRMLDTESPARGPRGRAPTPGLRLLSRRAGRGFGRRADVRGVRCWWVWMVVRFVCAVRVPLCVRVSRECPVCVPRLPRCLFTGTSKFHCEVSTETTQSGAAQRFARIEVRDLSMTIHTFEFTLSGYR